MLGNVLLKIKYELKMQWLIVDHLIIQEPEANLPLTSHITSIMLKMKDIDDDICWRATAPVSVYVSKVAKPQW